jgi:hypothetical protein
MVVPMALPISASSGENPTLKSTPTRGHTGIGARIASGGINMAQAHDAITVQGRE